MGGFGGMNPFPLRFGGGPSPAQRAYAALRSALGGEEANALGPEGGIEDLVRRCKARVMGASAATVEAAFAQALPHTATTHLDLWAGRLGVELEETMVATRAAVVAEWLRKARGDLPSLNTWLATLSPHLSTASTPWLSAKTSVPGVTLTRPDFYMYATERAGSRIPNVSSRYLVRVKWDHVAAGAASPGPELRRKIGDHLNVSLPSWVDWKIHQISGPFYLDGGPDGTSLLDLTPMGAP
jgi:hypothetical protein